MTGPTILQIVPELDTGGAELSAIEIAGAVTNAGGRCLVLSEGGRLVGRLEAAGGEFVSFPAASKNPLRIWHNARRLARLIADENVDLVHARSRAPAWSALLAARRTKKPFVTTVHGAHKENSAVKKFYNSVMAKGDIVIANSKFTAGIVRDRYAVPGERTRVIYRGIDPEIWNPQAISPNDIATLRDAWNIPQGAPIVLLAARLSPIKGHRLVVEATRLLKQRGQLGDAIVVFAGDSQGRDGYVAELHQLIAAAGLTDRIRMPGHVSKMPIALAAAHVALLTSTVPETFGRTVAEAGAMGCPVIAPDLGAPPELMLTGATGSASAVTGWIIPAADLERLAETLATALTLTADERTAIGEHARRHVLGHFTLEAMRRQTLAVYDELLGTTMAADPAP